jgi:hypothetical protein
MSVWTLSRGGVSLNHTDLAQVMNDELERGECDISEMLPRNLLGGPEENTKYLSHNG